MKTKYTTIYGAISDWIDDGGIDIQDIDESLLKKWALDCYKVFKRTDQLVHKLAILDVYKYKAELPPDFNKVAQAAYRYEQNKQPCGRREQITQWVHGTLEKDCELEINLLCSKCHKTDCSCNSPIMEVDVDTIWEQAHPELYHKHFSRIGRWGYGHLPESYYTPDFKIMKYKSTDWFQIGKFFIPECANIYCERYEETFMIEHPYIEVSFPKGEILLSYLGEKTDEEGNPYIPDITEAHEAIYWWLEKKWWWKMARKTLEPREARAYMTRFGTAEVKADQAIGRAISKLSLPDYKDLDQILRDSWVRRAPVKDAYNKYYHYMSLDGSSKEKYYKNYHIHPGHFHHDHHHHHDHNHKECHDCDK